MITRRTFLMSTAAVSSIGLAGCASFEESPVLKAEHLVDQSIVTVERFKTIKATQRFQQFLPEAVGVAVFPQIIKAGWFVGAEGGNGLLMGRTATGWSSPAFYTLGAGSFGLQIGAQDTEVLLVIRSRDALDAILEDQAKLGADAGVTLGTIGVGAEAATTTNLGVDVLAFANARFGGFIGASVEGGVMARRQDMNEAVYGAGVLPTQIISDPSMSMARADRLKTALGS